MKNKQKQGKNNIILILFLVLLVSIVMVAFALQNSGSIQVSLFHWNIHSSIALVLVVAFAMGVILTTLCFIPVFFRYRRRIRNLNKEAIARASQPSPQGDSSKVDVGPKNPDPS